ncbi:MAG: TRAP transporter substrate-binding protein DctP [Roseovarius sp.]
MSKLLPKAKATAAFCILAAFASHAAAAEDVIRLKVAGFMPVGHFLVQNGSKTWRDEVTKLTDGRVQFDYFPAQQLGKATQMLELVQTGVADIGEVAPAYSTSKLPLYGALEVPGLVKSSCSGTRALSKLSKPGGVIYENDLKPSNVRAMASFVYPAYHLFTADKKVSQISDFAGMKIRTSGGAMEHSVSALAGVPVKMSAPDIYQSLSRGTIDGVLFTYFSTRAYDLHSISKYATVGEGFGSASVIIMMDDKKWNSLPADVQDAMTKAGVVAESNFCGFADDREVENKQSFKDNGMTIVELSDDAKAEVANALNNVAPDWAAEMKKRGKPGAQAISDLEAALNAED